MPVKVAVTSTVKAGGSVQNDYLLRLVEQARACLHERPDPRYRRYTLCERPGDADIVLYYEPYKHKRREYVSTLLAEGPIRHYPNRCFVHDFEPEPLGLLPGVYTSMTSRRMNPVRHRTGGYPGSHNPWPARLGSEESRRCGDASAPEPRYLFSFRGSATSHELRKAILSAGFRGKDVAITQTFKWFDHDEDEKRTYAEEMRDSKFVLCPRGIATSSYRCYEAMALGRVPVILSDAWVPPAGPDWGEFALIVAEDRIADLPDILRAHEPHWRAMGRAARAAWEEWFAPEIITYRVLRSIEAILLTRGANHDERTYQEEWTRWRFAYASGWTLPQRAYAALRSGRVADKMRALGRREWTDREHQKKESRA